MDDALYQNGYLDGSFDTAGQLLNVINQGGDLESVKTAISLIMQGYAVVDDDEEEGVDNGEGS